MIKHFGVYPIGFDKNNLFEEQKIFLIYLMGVIPDHSEWNLNVEYQTKLQEIKKLSLKDIEITDTDIDLARLQNKNIEDVKKERLRDEKQKRTKELNKKYGIKEKEEKTEEIIQTIPEEAMSQRQQLWDILEGKGLIKGQKNGLQNKV